jgi:preprotein translocase subunit SecE
MAWVNQIRDFVKEVQVESTKISWPTRTELRDSTVVVIIAVLLMMVFVYIADSILRLGISMLFR